MKNEEELIRRKHPDKEQAFTEAMASKLAQKYVFAKGERIAFRPAIRSTHQDELLGIAPTGKQVAVDLVEAQRTFPQRSACNSVAAGLRQVSGSLKVNRSP
jgi:hypothetical protein